MNNSTISIDTLNVIIPSSEDTDNEDMENAVSLLRSARENMLCAGKPCGICKKWLDNIDSFIESVTND